MATAPPAQVDAVLDALALVEARLRHDDAAFSYLLGTGPNRRQASMLADLMAAILTRQSPEPMAAVDGLRQLLLAASEDGGGEPQ